MFSNFCIVECLQLIELRFYSEETEVTYVRLQNGKHSIDGTNIDTNMFILRKEHEISHLKCII